MVSKLSPLAGLVSISTGPRVLPSKMDTATKLWFVLLSGCMANWYVFEAATSFVTDLQGQLTSRKELHVEVTEIPQEISLRHHRVSGRLLLCTLHGCGSTPYVSRV